MLGEDRRVSLAMEGSPSQNGEFEIVCITAGEGNGWIFPAETLIAAVPLFDGVQCFIDHAPFDSWEGHSVRDLAGLISKPVWDENLRGIRAQLRPFGPGSEILTETVNEILAMEGVQTKVGFSADLGFQAENDKVTQITKIYSCDLVIDPARGGAVIRAMNSIRQKKQENMIRSNMAKDYQSVASMRQNQEKLAQLTQEAAQARALRVEMCKHVLDTTLSTSNLPTPIRDRIRKQFSNKLFEPAELDEAIKDGRELYSALSQGQAVQGLTGRFHGMYSSQDQINAAVHDLLGATRPKGLENVQCAKLSGIRELYTMMTGDWDFHGGYYADRIQLATTDLPGVLKNALNKLIAMRWEELGASGYRWWEKIVTVEHFDNLQDVTGILIGEMTVLPSVAESGTYQPLGVSDSAEVGSWTKYGGYIPLTIEMFERDDTMRLRQYPLKLAEAGLRRISANVANVFTANSGVGPVMADTYKVFDATHHFNLGTTALSSAQWEAACSAIWNQNMLVASGGTAPKLAVDAKYLLVPRALRLTAQKILYPSLAYESYITSENMQRGEFGDVITCPEFSDPTDWVAIADPRIAPAIYIGERFGLLPEIYIADNQLTGALFTNDEIRIKARHFLNVMVTDYRPLYKANVADS